MPEIAERGVNAQTHVEPSLVANDPIPCTSFACVNQKSLPLCFSFQRVPENIPSILNYKTF